MTPARSGWDFFRSSLYIKYNCPQTYSIIHWDGRVVKSKVLTLSNLSGGASPSPISEEQVQKPPGI
jgi:hypothetical protein